MKQHSWSGGTEAWRGLARALLSNLAIRHIGNAVHFLTDFFAIMPTQRAILTHD